MPDADDLEVIDGPVQPIDPDAGAEPDGPQAPEWLGEDVDPEIANFIQAQGFRSPADLARAARDLQSRSTRAEQERQALMEGLLSAQGADDEDDWEDDGGYDQPGQDVDPIAMAERIGRAIDEGRVDTATGMRDAIAYTANTLINAFRAELAQRDAYYNQAIEPLNSWQEQTAMSSAAQGLRQQYGPIYDEVANEVAEVIDMDPERFNSPQGIEAAFGIVLARKGPDGIAAMRRPPEFTSGGSRGPNRAPSLAAQIVKGIDSAGPGGSSGMKL